MIKTTVGLSGYLLLWLAIFLGKTLYPHAQSLYRGIVGTAEHAWAARFREHERFQRFIALTTPWFAPGNGQTLFAYGGDADLEKIGHFAAATKYLLYPASPFTHAAKISTTISHIAIYQTKQEVFRHLPFCHQLGEGSYVCKVRPGQEPLQAYDIRVNYKPPELTISAQAIKPGELDPAFLIIFAKGGYMAHPSVVLVTRQSVIDNFHAEISVYRFQLAMPMHVTEPVVPFHLLVVDKRGLLSASAEHRVVFAP